MSGLMPIRCVGAAHTLSQAFEIGRSTHVVVILGRSKVRSDAAQTLGSIPLRPSAATVQNSVGPHSSVKVTEWIPGSSRRRFAAASRWNDEADTLRHIPTRRRTPLRASA
ncbi:MULTISPECIES: hypothetical protein [unclassified Mesorhizobium]|uniref:hypothetical protein n=1 Tax=unclassified Mesorhizobium TaxID=325217 RepID=UPI000FCC5696|nr:MULTISPECIES: hypothetical protein [unclassified Mesorhizobium]RUW06907.1 hypothetical protein EOA53_22305 [Mesorhizobium sp. M1A.F.Ca.IN.020.03.1.1]MDG4908463.1 hypothetical protein [Mesorhizobium sp. WSM4898]RUW00878.1 hypothetical protein EOA49_13380 [Mesorhizobium sp. M1A.F.Ca.IN.020.04.1.1]RWG27467.1 MAG: hypothetical protein EOQ61_23550 [Mesorhizobium sp.]RWH13740.1 MAG: hypothetical protein EOQ74_13085 [Mesorhizobium sp.]